MNDFLRQLLSQMRGAWERMDQGQRIVSCSIVAVTVITLVGVAVWAGRPEYALLYSGLDEASAATIADKLQQAKVPYKLAGGGSVIMVPADKRDELRLQLAGEGVQGSVLGYELLDRSSLGVTDRQQEVNIRRALEGELAKTIQSLDAVLWARVHIAEPEKSFYAREKEEPRASVLVKCRPGTDLSRSEVAAIRCLVASAVEGMRPSGVTVTDTEMRVLAKASGEEDDAEMSAGVLELRQRTEKYLSEKVESMLANVLGPGHAIVRVSAELQTEQSEVSAEKFDPDGKVVRSEQRKEQSSTTPAAGTPGAAAPAAAAGQQRTEESITNYEINRTVEKKIDRGGSIKRLSVAVVLDGTYQDVEGEDGTVTRQFVPRTQEELARYTEIVKQAVGYDETRGDEVSVVSAPFDTSAAEELKAEMAAAARKDMIAWAGRRAMTIIGVALGLFYLRSKLRKLSGTETKPAAAEEQPAEPAVPVAERASEIARRSPGDVADLLRVWMNEG